MPRPGNMLFLISYDIPSSTSGDRRRARLARYLEGIGLRVQMSVFELDISPEKLGSVCAAVEERILAGAGHSAHLPSVWHLRRQGHQNRRRSPARTLFRDDLVTVRTVTNYASH